MHCESLSDNYATTINDIVGTAHKMENAVQGVIKKFGSGINTTVTTEESKSQDTPPPPDDSQDTSGATARPDDPNTIFTKRNIMIGAGVGLLLAGIWYMNKK